MAGAAPLQNKLMDGSGPDEPMPANGARQTAMNAAQGSIVVKAPVADVYKRWLRFEDYPTFISAVKRARKLDETHFSAVLAFRGKEHEAMLEIMLRVPERRLAWRILSNGGTPGHFAAGVVSFAARPGQRTCIDLKLTSSFGGAISHRIDKYLHNFKRSVEANRASMRLYAVAESPFILKEGASIAVRQITK
jgi:uncharacterized membrane protein